jgi:hypothetical protein
LSDQDKNDCPWEKRKTQRAMDKCHSECSFGAKMDIYTSYLNKRIIIKNNPCTAKNYY